MLCNISTRDEIETRAIQQKDLNKNKRHAPLHPPTLTVVKATDIFYFSTYLHS